MSRREFTRNQKEQIVRRATVNGVVRCERCHAALKPGQWEIDHIIPEALRPDADKKGRLTIADGQLLGKCCHRGPDGKTNADVKKIAKAKRQAAKHIGIVDAPKMQGRPFPKTTKSARREKAATSKLPLPGPKPLYVKEARS